VVMSWTAHSGTAETLDVEIQTTGDQTSANPEWETIGSFDTLGNAAAGTGSRTITVEGVRRYLRVRSTIRGTSPSFTFSVAASLGYREFALRIRDVRVDAIGDDDTTASDVIRDLLARAGISDALVEDTSESVMPLDVSTSTYGEPADLMALYADKAWGIVANGFAVVGVFRDFSDQTWTALDPEDPRDPVSQKQFSRVLVPFRYAGGHAEGLAEGIADPNPLGTQVTAPPISLQNEPADDTLALAVAQRMADYLVQPRTGGTRQFSFVADPNGLRVHHHKFPAAARMSLPVEDQTLRADVVERSDQSSTVHYAENVPIVERVNARRQRRLELRGL